MAVTARAHTVDNLYYSSFFFTRRISSNVNRVYIYMCNIFRTIFIRTISLMMQVKRPLESYIINTHTTATIIFMISVTVQNCLLELNS